MRSVGEVPSHDEFARLDSLGFYIYVSWGYAYVAYKMKMRILIDMLLCSYTSIKWVCFILEIL